MEKESQTKIVLSRTIAGEEFANLKSQIHSPQVFSNFAPSPRKLCAEDVFKDSTQMPTSQKPKPMIVTRPKRVFSKPITAKPNGP